MTTLLTFENPLEFLLRYTVIFGAILAMFGVALILSAKRITMAVRKQDEINRNDKLFNTLRFVGICLVLAGMIVIALPVNATMYRG